MGRHTGPEASASGVNRPRPIERIGSLFRHGTCVVTPAAVLRVSTPVSARSCLLARQDSEIRRITGVEDAVLDCPSHLN